MISRANFPWSFQNELVNAVILFSLTFSVVVRVRCPLRTSSAVRSLFSLVTLCSSSSGGVVVSLLVGSRIMLHVSSQQILSHISVRLMAINYNNLNQHAGIIYMQIRYG